ncbi:MAG: hypothetical protein AAGG48_28630 [Planctomycetota bacterium]
MQTKTRFVSVEIAIRTNHECDAWIEWFERQDNYVKKSRDEQYAWSVYFDPLPSLDANSTIQNLCKKIESLPEQVKSHWTNAGEREFFIGYHVGESPSCFTEFLDAKTIELVYSHRASIRIALYPTPDERDWDD